MEPINTRDPVAAARAYLALEWPLTVGHCYRPQRGCTCGDTTCRVPGAHPKPGPLIPLAPDPVVEAVRTTPGASLITMTERFDALVLPRTVAMHAMVRLDRIVPVPCIVYAGVEDRAALLVLPATGRYAAVDPRVEVRTGADGWLPRPPSRGVRWDTSPWIEPTPTARPLLHGSDVGRVLRELFTQVEVAVR